MPVIFIDVVWLINFVMDAVILVAAAWMGRRKVRWWRIALGSAVGASYALLFLMPGGTEPFISWGAKILFSCLMVILTFHPKNVLEFLRFWGLFYLASFVIGGATYGLNFLLGETRPIGGMVLVSHEAVWGVNKQFVLLSIPVIYLIGKVAWNRIERFKKREGNLWHVELALEGVRVEFTGLLDTGNVLTDPISGLPVAVVEWRALEPLLPPSLLEAYREHRDVTMDLGEKAVEGDWQSRLRIVPYRGVGGTVGMLLAFRPSKFVVRQGETVSAVSKILVAINPKPMSGDEAYHAILPPACIAETDSSIAS
ncbi:sigma-E processing peptidase SpoIIGA [Effusibacillus consociatus]|uniref:Sigma-E processing peptidase SpoIIGA n=1 Tax=Effusibacillus consociatus TaxID=1117041 RepID=A0ABV9Q8I2_9BACL